mgnify:CR=1 FL=1
MLLSMRYGLCLLVTLLLLLGNVYAYDLNGINATFDFGTVAPPFPDLTLTDNSICVGYTLLLEPRNYYVRATSSSSSSTAFQLTNTSNNIYKLNYSVAWAGIAGGSPSFVSLASGQNSSSTFAAQLLGGLTCLLLPNNATLQLRLLGSQQAAAKQGSYVDTLTILIVAS